MRVRSDSREYRSYRFEKQYLESEERYLGDGLFPLEFEFYQLIDGVVANDGFKMDSFGAFSFMMNQDTKQHNRSVYSILDFLGDVGGLSSILLSIGASVTQFISYLGGC